MPGYGKKMKPMDSIYEKKLKPKPLPKLKKRKTRKKYD